MAFELPGQICSRNLALRRLILQPYYILPEGDRKLFLFLNQ
ncbi:MAG TPA: hypothetical protein V6D15_13800 [Oculatellaceae cyanobacterium]